ncbi:LysR family transcriptional regulator [Photobacterium sp. ZSDE20]|uniref:LysR family transcriptional regulator n=1 Tax=Photobacterium pectinilyticum TaxID=2906793 RepID=A0ABT1MY00_9GAMM|nr:LysR family transcriptional regulator [Photobacterium sp. ZSDE20]MCQ1057366.1 LysR family transcriptional regulator [Photobacterium sp. ZSDE20]MDD1821685.1 LysR family transcriptional regulator [Photobacterium sp. ZSDE20]
MQNVNLNLLRTLQVLLEESHVSRTAERLCVTQSAVSRQLTQLRELFGDPLLIREGNRLLPTPKALQLKGKVDNILASCQGLLEEPAFSPQQWTGPMIMASSDYVAQYILPDIVERVQQQAPQVNISYRLWSPEYLSNLADLDIQLVSTMLPKIPEGLCGALIGSDFPVCVMRGQHPLANEPELSLAQLAGYPHMRVSAGGDKDSFVERELKVRGLHRDVQFSVPFFSAAFQTLVRTDMLMVLPEHISRNMQAWFDITYKPLPIPKPTHSYWLLWHLRYENDPAHRWFREQVLMVMKSSMYSI